MRVYIIDTLRGIAFSLMFIFHIFVAINILTPLDYDLHNFYLYYIGYIARTLFILLFGISLCLSYYNSSNLIEYKKKQLYKSRLLLFCGIIITILTYIYIPNNYIVFGILHFLSISLLLLFHFVNNIPLLLFISFLSIYIQYSNNFNQRNFIISMFIPAYKNTIDHFHITTYIHIIIIGILIGHFIKYIQSNYPKLFNKYNIKHSNILSLIGQNSLLLYMLHIPLIYIFTIYYF